jgi:hypothetical protein
MEMLAGLTKMGRRESAMRMVAYNTAPRKVFVVHIFESGNPDAPNDDHDIHFQN